MKLPHLYTQRAELFTVLTPRELSQRLSRQTFSRPVLGATGSAALGRFWGDVGEDGFSLRRVTDGMSAFEPVINGVVTPTANGSRIVVTMVPQEETNRITLCLIVLLMAGTALCLWQIARTGFRPMLLSPAVLLALSLVLPRITWRSAFHAAKAAFVKLLP